LLNLQQKGPTTDHIQKLQKISLRVKNNPEDNLLDLFMGTLNENIQHEVGLFEPESLDKDFSMAKKVENKNMATRMVTSKTYRENCVPFPNINQSKRLTPQQIDERIKKGLCFNCDNKYSKGYKCGEKKLFYIECEEEEDQELEPSQDPNIEDTTPTIYFHALANINTPQTLNIQGYTKKKKVTMLIVSDNTHNFINYKLAKDLNLFVYIASEFQVMIADGGTINCFGMCHSIKLNMWEYFLDSPMISIQMGGVDVVLGVSKGIEKGN
jgi:hypothetical protein